MKAKYRTLVTAAATLVSLAGFTTTLPAQDFEAGSKWRGWVDMGGVFGAHADLKEFAGPATGKLTLSPGVQMDLGFGYRITPWLQIGPEIGMTYNSVDAFGDISYPNTYLFQLPLLANATFEYPYWGRFVPYAGVGVGGVVSCLTFGEHWEWDPDGTGSEFVFGAEAFAGFRYRLSNSWSVGAVYRFLSIEPQTWDVEWWNGGHFNVGIDRLQSHSVCLSLVGTF